MKLWRYKRPIERLGQRYRLDGSLGSGGMADVCLAWDEREEREVAVKVIKPDELDQKTLDRFLKEASQVAKWNHPHILHVYSGLNLELLDVVQGSIVPYIVMEYAQGGDLQKRLKVGQPYPFGETLRIFAQLCSAVQYAHEHGVIHRDLKPPNILFRRLTDGSEQLILSDFGLAVEIEATHHTFANAGTLAYMAPEQLQGHAQLASDIFALGVILYKLCTGRLPFRRSLQDLRRTEPLETPLRPSAINPELPKALDDVILTALSEEPALRFATAALFWENVRVAVTPPSVPFTTPVNRTVKPLPPLPYVSTTSPQPSTAPPTSAATSSGKVSIQASPIGNGANTANANNSNGPAIIEPPVVDSRATIKLPVTASAPVVSPDPQLRSANRAPTQSSGDKTAARSVGPASRTPGAPLVHTAGSGNVPPRRGNVGVGGRTKRKQVIGIALLLLILPLIGGGIIYATPGVLGLGSLIGITPKVASRAAITITPDSKVVSNSYTISAVTGTPNASQRQVGARLLSSAPASQQKTVNATGVKQIPATRATGTLTFYNGAFTSQTVLAGTVFTGADGVQVVSGADATIPPSTSGGNSGTLTVSAHAVNSGASGNIRALDINQACCSSNSSIFVKNLSSFSGGQDPQNYTVVQESDIDNAAAPLRAPLLQQAQNDLKSQIHANEQLATPVQCISSSTANQAAGDKASTVTVTVEATCETEVYDQKAVQTLVAGLLQTQAQTNPGAGYALVGVVVTDTKVQSVSVGTVALLVTAKGRWVYQFTDAQKQALKQLIAGKTVDQTKALLQSQKGISASSPVDIQVNGNTLPTDIGQISIVVQNVAGFQRGGSPGGVNMTPTGIGPISTTPTPQTGMGTVSRNVVKE